MNFMALAVVGRISLQIRGAATVNLGDPPTEISRKGTYGFKKVNAERKWKQATLWANKSSIV